jgi:hypothetical protein
VTKAFTATAIGELVAEGKMDWENTPVSHYLPEFQLKDPVLTSQLTLADMLAHRTVSQRYKTDTLCPSSRKCVESTLADLSTMLSSKKIL